MEIFQQFAVSKELDIFIRKLAGDLLIEDKGKVRMSSSKQKIQHFFMR